MSYLRPRESTTFSNRKAWRWRSGRPRNCSRTSGCSSVSLLIGIVTRTSLPARSRPSTYLPSVGQYDPIRLSPSLPAFVDDGFHCCDDRFRRAHDVGNDARYRLARLRIEIEVQTFRLLV